MECQTISSVKGKLFFTLLFYFLMDLDKFKTSQIFVIRFVIRGELMKRSGKHMIVLGVSLLCLLSCVLPVAERYGRGAPVVESTLEKVRKDPDRTIYCRKPGKRSVRP